MWGDDEADLVERALAGDRAAQEAIYRFCSRQVTALLRRRLNDPLEVEDAVQDTFERVFRSLSTFDPERGSFSGWVATIAMNLGKKRSRECWLRNRFTLTDPFALARLEDELGEPLQDSALMERLDDEELMTTLEQLSPLQSQTILLRYVNDLSVEETARAMNRSSDAIYKLERRALVELKEVLTEATKDGVQPQVRFTLIPEH